MDPATTTPINSSHSSTDAQLTKQLLMSSPPSHSSHSPATATAARSQAEELILTSGTPPSLTAGSTASSTEDVSSQGSSDQDQDFAIHVRGPAFDHDADDAISDDTEILTPKHPGHSRRGSAVPAFETVNTDTSAETLDVPKRPLHIRFRSRVRIASGLPKKPHRTKPKLSIRPHAMSDANDADGEREGDGDVLNPRSVASCNTSSDEDDGEGYLSSSSSISAPLCLNPENRPSTLGTLGQRIGRYAEARRTRYQSDEERRKSTTGRDYWQGVGYGPPSPSSPDSPYAAHAYGSNSSEGERSPLISRRRPYSPSSFYGYRRYGTSMDYEEWNDSEVEEDAVLAKQIDFAFGTWPGRILNYHWWWWQLEPIVTCRCLDDTEDEM
ncbi:hypothetical protein BDN72DRAFT_1609 [Pluteus cervinus]|uniref:Uncharacterized protein n=1 Tax=Pluteus cervinus TaxID=181527 RepID=A0ACD3BG50_9AGAR|nr:hypothetical protein BDN72DRAFT_1609 [Pluteus cervinus]